MIVSDAVASYLASVVPEPDPVLAEMRAHGRRDRIPIVVPETGVLLSVLTAAVGARRVVEVGTAIGVSTLHIARALPDGGTIVSFEIDRERHEAAARYLDRAGVSDRADLRLQDAAEGLAALEGPFDVAFLDGVKDDYPRHLELVMPLVRRGGVIAVDNVLLSGTVAEGHGDGHWTDDHVSRMRGFNAALAADPALLATVLPVGDGVAVAVRQ